MYNIQALPRKNSKKYSKTIAKIETIDEVKQYLADNNIVATSTPYLFTHINLSNGQIITQTTIIGIDKAEIICSPVKLAEALNLKS